jgi:MoaA/NifB/PqqE/SkfB family radical SAM enzyme
MRMRRKLCHLVENPSGVSYWSNAIMTSRLLPALREQFDVTVPPTMNLEINTDCNYRCRFCPQSSHPRPPEYVTMESYRLVLQKLQDIDYAGKIVLSVNNEPFLHPALMEFCKLAAAELPQARLVLISNGSLIKQEHLAFLASLTYPVHLIIDDYTSGHVVNQRLREWSRALAGSRMICDFKDRSASEVLSNRAGNQPDMAVRPSDYRRVACTWPFGGLFVRPDLKVFLCCSDFRYEMIAGDLKRQSIMEIWNGDALAGVRKALLVPDRGGVSLCARCDAEWFCLPEYISEHGVAKR